MPVEEETPGLIRAGIVLRERWWVVLISVIVCVGVALALSKLATKQYTATSKLLFAQNQLVPEVGGSTPAPSADPQADQATNLQLVTTNEVAAAVKVATNTPLTVSELLDEVSTSNDSSSNIVDVSATDSSPTQAAQIANAFAVQYVATSKATNVAQVRAGQQLINQKIAALPPGDTTDRTNLEAALQKLVVLEAVQTGNAQVVDLARVPTSPSSPNTKVNLIVAFVFGLALGAGIAFLLNLLDRRLRTVEEVEEIYGTRALATIPGQPQRGAGALHKGAVEQFQILRAGLSLLTPGRDARVALVTSAVPGEGKTTVAIGLARAAASAGQSAILVEADFKRPDLSNRLGIGEDETGLSNALLTGEDPFSVLRSPVRGVPNLQVLTSGPHPPNPAALLRGPAMARVIEQLTADADLVVLDAPPLLPVADAQALLDHPQVDVCVVVSRVYFTKRDEARRTRQLLELREMGGIALVVNGVRQVTGGHYYGATAVSTPGQTAD